MEHTKGPWKTAGQGNGKGELSILGPDGEIACIRNKAHLGDARLIAAAPKLLDVLHYCRGELVGCSTKAHENAIRQIDEVVAKAEAD